MLGNAAVDAELSRSLGLTIKEIVPILAVGGDPSWLVRPKASRAKRYSGTAVRLTANEVLSRCQCPLCTQ